MQFSIECTPVQQQSAPSVVFPSAIWYYQSETIEALSLMRKMSVPPTLVIMPARMLNRTARGSGNRMTLARNERAVSEA
jgi:hypothetical protein